MTYAATDGERMSCVEVHEGRSSESYGSCSAAKTFLCFFLRTERSDGVILRNALLKFFFLSGKIRF